MLAKSLNNLDSQSNCRIHRVRKTRRGGGGGGKTSAKGASFLGGSGNLSL